MQYQSFPGVKGSSESLEKLKALRLPPLKGKKFIDLGCNEGFFCGFALFAGAAEITGIDRSEAAIGLARSRFPECRFLAQSWEQLPEEKFDVILLLSALHYAEDQEALIHRLMAALDTGGVLIMELGVLSSGKSEWVKVKRSIDERWFPTRSKLGEILEPYAWKIVSRSVAQAGDPVNRFVVHVTTMRPFAYLMLENPGMGKSTIARTLFSRTQIPVVRGDMIYQRIRDGLVESDPALKQAVTVGLEVGGNDQAANSALSAGLADRLVDVWCAQGGDADFAVDSYVPVTFRQTIIESFEAHGYVPVQLSWEMDRSMAARDTAERGAKGYFEFLARRASENRLPEFLVRRLRSPDLKAQLFKWHVDYPANGQLFTDGKSVELAGWMLPMPGKSGAYRCFVRSGPAVEYFEFNRKREDVIKKYAQQPPQTNDASKMHGFSHRLDPLLAAAGFEFGFELNGKEFPVASIRVRTPSKSDLLMARITHKLRARLAKAVG